VWVGCWPGLSTEMLDWIVESVGAFLAQRRSSTTSAPWRSASR
jgi:hypothetical protein